MKRVEAATSESDLIYPGVVHLFDYSFYLAIRDLLPINLALGSVTVFIIHF